MVCLITPVTSNNAHRSCQPELEILSDQSAKKDHFSDKGGLQRRTVIVGGVKSVVSFSQHKTHTTLLSPLPRI